MIAPVLKKQEFKSILPFDIEIASSENVIIGDLYFHFISDNILRPSYITGVDGDIFEYSFKIDPDSFYSQKFSILEGFIVRERTQFKPIVLLGEYCAISNSRIRDVLRTTNIL